MEFLAADVLGGGARGGGGANMKGAEGSGGSSSSAAAAVAGVSKRRKVDVSRRIDHESGDASADSPCVVQRERCEVAEVEVNSPAVGESFGAPVAASVEAERCLSVYGEDPGSTSCCSSNESSEVVKKTTDSADLEVKSEEVDATTIQARINGERQRRGEVAGADDADKNNTPKPPAETNSHRRQLRGRMPTQAEIDDFFSAVETDTRLRFKQKYNFDFEKEEPLKGRYEWKPLIPAAKEEKIMKA